MERSCRVGVFGVGHLGSIHARLLSEIALADLVGLYDVEVEKAAKLGQELGVRAFSKPGDLLREIDVAIIAASTKAHYELALAAAESNVNLFIEKPLADTADRARKILMRCAQASLKLGVGHIERFNRAVRAIEGTRIAPKFIEVHRLAAFTLRGADVAVVHDLMIHDLDLILHWIKAPIKRVDASTRPTSLTPESPSRMAAWPTSRRAAFPATKCAECVSSRRMPISAWIFWKGKRKFID